VYFNFSWEYTIGGQEVLVRSEKREFLENARILYGEESKELLLTRLKELEKFIKKIKSKQ